MKRIYFDFGNNQYARFATFDYLKADTIHIYLFGLKTKAAKISHRWQDQEITEEFINAQRFNFNEVNDLDIKYNLNYISLHPEGDVFRFQFSPDGIPALDVRTDKKIDSYIDFAIMSDLPEKYIHRTSTAKDPCEKLTVTDDNIWYLRNTVSIGNFDLRNHPILEDRIKKAHPNDPCTLFGTVNQSYVSKEHIKKRPEGTIVTFLFKQQGGKYLSSGVVVS